MSIFATRELAFQNGAPMGAARSDMTATLLPDNSILLVGGCSDKQTFNYDFQVFTCDAITNRTELYTPESATKAKVEVLAEAPKQRYRHTAAYAQGAVWVFGGVDIEENLIQDIDYFNVSTKEWTTLPLKWTDATTDLASFVLDDGELIHLLGGYTPPEYNVSNSMVVFNATTKGFQNDDKKAMDQARGDTTAVVYKEEAFVFGGFESQFCDPLEHVEKYDYKTNAWTKLSELGVGRGDKGVAVVTYEKEDLIAVFGGETKEKVDCAAKKDVAKGERPQKQEISIPLKSIEMYSPKDDKWTTLTEEMPKALFRSAVVSLTLKGDKSSTVFVFGGQGTMKEVPGAGGDKTLDVYLYDVSSEVVAFTLGGPRKGSVASASVASLVFTCLSLVFSFTLA